MASIIFGDDDLNDVYQLQDNPMHKKIEMKASKALEKDSKKYANEIKHAHGTKKKHEKIEMKEAKHGAKVLKKLAKSAHEY